MLRFLLREEECEVDCDIWLGVFLDQKYSCYTYHYCCARKRGVT